MPIQINDMAKRQMMRKAIFAVLGVVGLWIFGLVQYVDNLPSKPNSDDSIADGVVIFTGGSMRLEAGIELLNAGKAKRMLVSGVGEKTKLDLLLIFSGKLPDNILQLKDRIDLGYEAKNTRGNAQEVAKWVQNNGYKTIRLVTANYHMPRSYFELHSVMPDINIIQNPVFPGDIKMEKWWNSGVTKKVMISEYNKYMLSRVASLFGM